MFSILSPEDWRIKKKKEMAARITLFGGLEQTRNNDSAGKYTHTERIEKKCQVWRTKKKGQWK